MNQPVCLRYISDIKLLEDLKSRVQSERDLLTEVLRYLREVERRKLFLSRGYSSLFSFCMGELAYSERQAHTRIQAMRLLKAVPEAEVKIASGELSLSVAAAAQSAFARSVKLDKPVIPETKKKIVAELSGLSARKAERTLFAHLPVMEVPAERTKTVSAELTRIEFNANQKLLEKLEKLKGLTAHKNFDGSWDRLFDIVADAALEKFEAKPPKTNAPLLATSQVNSKDVRRPQAAPSTSRYIPANVRRIVWQRDRGRCQFIDPVTLKHCESVHGLQFDHIHKFSSGGAHEPSNLRLMCAGHNQFRM